jgi:hypothetical protein
MTLLLLFLSGNYHWVSTHSRWPIQAPCMALHCVGHCDSSLGTDPWTTAVSLCPKYDDALGTPLGNMTAWDRLCVAWEFASFRTGLCVVQPLPMAFSSCLTDIYIYIASLESTTSTTITPINRLNPAASPHNDFGLCTNFFFLLYNSNIYLQILSGHHTSISPTSWLFWLVFWHLYSLLGSKLFSVCSLQHPHKPLNIHTSWIHCSL